MNFPLPRLRCLPSCRSWLPAWTLLLALVPAPAAPAADTVTLRLGTILPSGTPQYNALQAMVEQWRKLSDGKVKVIMYPDGRLGGESEMVKKMRIKQLNAALLTVVGISEIDPGVTGLQLIPLAFKTWDEVDYVREKMRPLLEQKLRARGYEVLFWSDAGWVRFFTKEPAVRPAEFKRLKIFSWSGDMREAEIMKSTGYRPVSLETTDILLGLNTDLINAVPVPPLIALAGQFYGPAPHMLDMNWVPIVGAAVVRSDVWNQLPPELQQKLREVAEATGVKTRALSRVESEESVKAMQGRGLQVHALTPQAAAEWQQMAEAAWPSVRGQVVPADVYDAVQRHLAEFRQGRPPGAETKP